ncbi:putative ankyrin repeat-containing domain, PGG domain-containing protein [Rosa chinensis]|uniref:Putative ankyrin repeat-containing domain, PGG domain-containing protein n=1 Tax=Rosa chinensis TaxID=74649 RepID=A0A2P6QW33_ROSCH|nr:putative ankyrin repeat-containing domain, PGG domain-containing protein [Rosa chinensis]
MASDEEIDSLFENAMKGQWEKVMEAYRNSITAQVAKVTRSKETALHIAIADGRTEIVLELVNIILHTHEDDSASTAVLSIANDRGNTPLHLAAWLGNVQVCHNIAAKAASLISVRNVEGETPLFLAALNGNTKAFLCLNFHCQEKPHSSIRDNNGDTILHAAISGEYFSLAFQIIWMYPELVNSINRNGSSPLHILASKPNAFKSSCRLELCDHLIYKCLMIEELKVEEYNHEACLSKAGDRNSSSYPENYETCMNFFQVLRSLFQVWHVYWHKTHSSLLQANGGNAKGTNGPVDDEENPKQGIWGIRKIQEKKERHIWANQVMNELVDRASLYKYRNTGQNPQETQPSKDKEEYEVPNPTMPEQASPLPSDHAALDSRDTSTETTILSSNQYNYKIGSDKNEQGELTSPPFLVYTAFFIDITRLGDFHTHHAAHCTERKNNNPLVGKKNVVPGKNQSPVLIAAKMGITEMVEKILDKFPVAIQDVDSDNKNVILLAVENRQPHVYNLLQKREILKESLFRQLDNEGNSALHLAATCGQYRPWLIPGAALQMQWEIKWYKFVKNSMPHRYFVRYNNRGQTPKEIFEDTHKHLIKEGSKWLIKTSESCSVVAALIATVAFATSATVPGGLDQHTGEPILKDKTAFSAFTISSLVALCFSITSLDFFLSILTSRYEESDFSMDLPRKLLIGLTSLFASIASMLVSFCTGHIFLLKHQLRYVAYSLYAATCLPVTFFALAQLPLYFDLMKAIIRKVPQRSYEVYPH